MVNGPDKQFQVDRGAALTLSSHRTHNNPKPAASTSIPPPSRPIQRAPTLPPGRVPSPPLAKTIALPPVPAHTEFDRLSLVIDKLLSKARHQDLSDRLLDMMLAEHQNHRRQFIRYVEETLGTGQIKVTERPDKRGGARTWRERARELKNALKVYRCV